MISKVNINKGVREGLNENTIKINIQNERLSHLKCESDITIFTENKKVTKQENRQKYFQYYNKKYEGYKHMNIYGTEGKQYLTN